MNEKQLKYHELSLCMICAVLIIFLDTAAITMGTRDCSSTSETLLQLLGSRIIRIARKCTYFISMDFPIYTGYYSKLQLSSPH